MCSLVIWVKSRSAFLPRLQAVLQCRGCQDSNEELHMPGYQSRALATASWEYTSRSDRNTGETNILPHTNPADGHCRKHLILLGCLS